MVRRYRSASRRLPLYRSLGRGTMTRSGVAGSTRHLTAKGASEMPMYGPRPTASALVPVHFQDEVIGLEEFNTTGNIFQINRQIQRGTSINQFSGSRFYMTGLQIRGQVYVRSFTGISNQTLMIVLDKRPRGASAAITDIVDTISPFSFQNISNRDRFEILYRKNFNLTGTSTAPTSDSIEFFDVTLKFKKLVSTSVAAADTSVGNLVSGALYAVYLGSNLPGTVAVYGDLSYRVHFTDDE